MTKRCEATNLPHLTIRRTNGRFCIFSSLALDSRHPQLSEGHSFHPIVPWQLDCVDMSSKSGSFLWFGAALIVASIALAWFGFSTNNPNPAPALSSLAAAVVLFIAAVILISRGARGMPAVESPTLLRKGGSLVFLVGVVVTVYAAAAVFLLRDLPPNNAASRLPSLYLLFAGMLALFIGTVLRNFRLH